MKKLTVLPLSLLFLISCGETESNQNENNIKSTEETTTVSEEEDMTEIPILDSLSETTEEVVAEIDETNTTVSDPESIEESTPDKGINEIPEVITETIPKQEEIVEEVVIPKPNHSNWDGLLKKNVNSSGKVNYTGMKTGLVKIEAYIKQLESFSDLSALSRNEKLAYWINLYNAATVRLIVQNYPLKSITNINGGKPWDKKVVKIGSKQYTLNQIENDIIRPRFKEPRIHFAVNCAAKSCPKLMNSAFTADKLNYQLSKQAKAFINGAKNEISANKIVISKIFEWYSEDFTPSVIDFINKYSTTKIDASATVEYKEYNWDLNN